MALLAGLAAGIPLCFIGVICVFYRLYCRRDRKKDNMDRGRKLWRKSYEIVGSSHESLAIPKHAPKVVSKFVQDSPQLSSTSTTTHISPLEDQLCLSEDDDDDDNSSLSNYRTAPDEVYSPECRDTIELISLSPVKAVYNAENRTDQIIGIPPPNEPRKIPSIRVMDENRDLLFTLDAKPNSTHRGKRREDKIPLHLPSSVIQGSRYHMYSNPGMIDVSILYKQTTCELFLKVSNTASFANHVFLNLKMDKPRKHVSHVFFEKVNKPVYIAGLLAIFLQDKMILLSYPWFSKAEQPSKHCFIAMHNCILIDGSQTRIHFSPMIFVCSQTMITYSRLPLKTRYCPSKAILFMLLLDIVSKRCTS